MTTPTALGRSMILSGGRLVESSSVPCHLQAGDHLNITRHLRDRGKSDAAGAVRRRACREGQPVLQPRQMLASPVRSAAHRVTASARTPGACSSSEPEPGRRPAPAFCPLCTAVANLAPASPREALALEQRRSAGFPPSADSLGAGGLRGIGRSYAACALP
jgi:hypothetical protein